jgi:hypothetical protein
MFSLLSEEEGLAFLFLPPPVSFPISNVSDAQFQLRGPSRHLDRGSEVLYRYFGYNRVWTSFSKLVLE